MFIFNGINTSYSLKDQTEWQKSLPEWKKKPENKKVSVRQVNWAAWRVQASPTEVSLPLTGDQTQLTDGDYLLRYSVVD